jgi:hypothetical protein
MNERRKLKMAKKKTDVDIEAEDNIEVIEENTTEEVLATKTSKEKVKKTVPRRRTTQNDIPYNELIQFKSLTYGELIYKPKDTGYRVVWEYFGDVKSVPYNEVVKMYNSCNTFFRKNWIIPVGERAQDVIESLNLEEYYKHTVLPEEIETIINYSDKKLKEVVSKLTPSVKLAMALRCKDMIEEGKIDSVSQIKRLEEALNYKFSEEIN